MRIAIDTNIYAAYMQGDPTILDAFAASEEIRISVIVLGELLAGFRGGSRFQINRNRLLKFLAMPGVSVLNLDRETSDVFGQIWQALKIAGTPIPTHDIWIAAQAIQTGSMVMTYARHFRYVEGLRLWDFPQE